MSCDGLLKTMFAFEKRSLFLFQGDFVPTYETITNTKYNLQLKFQYLGRHATQFID